MDNASYHVILRMIMYLYSRDYSFSRSSDKFKREGITSCKYFKRVDSNLVGFHYFNKCIYIMFLRIIVSYRIALNFYIIKCQYSIFFTNRVIVFKNTSSTRKIKSYTIYADCMETVDLNEIFIPLTGRLLDSNKRIYGITFSKFTSHKREVYIKSCLYHSIARY